MVWLNNRHKSYLFKFLDKFGLRLYVAGEGRPIDLTELDWEHPLEALYQARAHRSVLMKVPIESLRTMGAHGFIPVTGGNSPFVQVAVEYINNVCASYEDSPLKKFYSSFQPNCPSELLNIKKSNLDWMESLPATATVLPWQIETPEVFHKQTIIHHNKANRQHKTKLQSSDGFFLFGPVSTEKGQLEYKRIINLIPSIKRQGLLYTKYDADNITADILIDGDNFAFHITSGQHRVSVAAALEESTIVIQVRSGNIIRKSEVSYWPLVRQGFYSKELALKVFDKIFEGSR